MTGKAVNVGTASIAVSGDTSDLLKTMRADISKMTASSIKGITESMEKLLKEMSKSSDQTSKKLIEDNARTEKKKTEDAKAEQAKRSATEDSARKAAEASEKAAHTRSMARTKELSGALTQAFRKRSVGGLTGGLSTAMSGLAKTTQESFRGAFGSVGSPGSAVIASTLSSAKKAMANASNFDGTAVQMGRALKSASSESMAGMRKAGDVAFAGVRKAGNMAFEAVKFSASKVFDGLKAATNSAFNRVKAIGTNVADSIKEKLSNAVSSLKSAALNLPSAGFGKIKSALSKPTTDGLTDGLKDSRIDAAASDAGKRMGGSMKTALMAAAPLAVIGMAGAKMKDVIGQGLTNASDLNEVMNKSETIWGKNAEAVKNWASTATSSFGTTKKEALDSLSQYGDMFLQVGIGQDDALKMSKELMERATDISSFSNMEASDVTERIMAGMRGEYDGLQKIVPRISAELVKDRMAAMNLADNSANRAKAVTAIILEDTKRAQGDFQKTAGGYANASRVARANIEELKGRLGKLFLPMAEGMLATFNNKLVPAANAFFDKLDKGEGGIKRITDIFKTFAKVVDFAKNVVVDIYKVLKTGAPDDSGIFAQLGMKENSPVIVFLSSIHKLMVFVDEQIELLIGKVKGLAQAFSSDWKTGNGFAGAMRDNIDLVGELFGYLKNGGAEVNWDLLNGAGINGDSPVVTFLDNVREKASLIEPAISSAASKAGELAGKGIDFAKGAAGDFMAGTKGTIGGNVREQVDDTINTALDAANRVRAQFQDDIVPSLQKMWGSIFDNINFSKVEEAIEFVAGAKTQLMKSINWDEIGKIVKNVLDVVTDLVTAVAVNVLPTLGRVWETLQPVFSKIVDKIGDLVNKIAPLVNYILESIQKDVLPALEKLWKEVIGPIFEALAKQISAVWDFLSPLIDALVVLLIPAMKQSWDSAVTAFKGIVDILSWAWSIMGPIIGAMTDNLSAIGTAMSNLPDTIRNIFVSVQSALRDASNVVIGAINEFFIDKLNWLIEKVTGKANYISQIPLVGTDSNENNPNFNGAQQFHERRGLATGGILPGFSPGYDNHHFFSPTAGFLSLSGGEAILRPEATLALGSGTINAMNAAARSGGVQGVLAMLSNMVPHQRYANGGVYNGEVKIDDGFTLNPFEHIKRAAQRLFAFIKKLIPEPIVRMVQESMKQLVDRLPLGGNLSSSIDEAFIYDRGGVLPPTPRGQAMVVANRSGRDEYVFTQPQLLERDRLISNSVGGGHTSTVNLHTQKVDSRNLSKVLQEAERRVQTRGKHGRR